MRIVIGLLIFIGGTIGSCAAIYYVHWQQHAMTQFVEVPATVISSDVKISRGSKSTSYSPAIAYRYVVDGQPYQSSQVQTFDYSSSDSARARSIVNRYPVAVPARGGVEPGALAPNAKAYVNPRDPNEAFLVHEYLFTPYLFSYLALFAALLGVATMFADAFTVGRETMEAVALDDSGWQLLMPKQNLKRRLRNALIWFVGMALMVVPLVVHWFVIAGGRSIGSIIGSAVPFAMLVGFGIAVYRRWDVSRHISDVRLRARPLPLKRGETFSLEMEADAISPLNVTHAAAKVICTEHYKERSGNKTSYGTRTRGEKNVDLCGAATVPAGQVLEGKGETMVESDAFPPTTDITVKNYPYFTWEIRMTVKLEGMVDYVGVFPLKVE